MNAQDRLKAKATAPQENNMSSIRINRHSSQLTESRTFASLSRARHYAAGQVTSTPAIVTDDWGTEYAVHDGVVLTVGGAHVRDLFPDVPSAPVGAVAGGAA